jgi:hypothetical protein
MTLDHNQLSFITEIKEKIRLVQYEALKAVNTHLIQLYWEIGRAISEKQNESWGKSIVPVLSRELQKEFPGISVFPCQIYGLWRNSIPSIMTLNFSSHWLEKLAGQSILPF